MESRVQRPTRRERRAPTRSKRVRWLVPVVALLGLLAAGLGILAQADKAAADREPRAAAVGGVPVGHVTTPDALARVEQEIGARARRSVRVRLSGRTYRISAKRAGVRIDLGSLVRRAVETGRE